MTAVELISALVSAYGLGWITGKAIKSFRQFSDHV